MKLIFTDIDGVLNSSRGGGKSPNITFEAGSNVIEIFGIWA